MQFWYSSIVLVTVLSTVTSKSYKCSVINDAGYCFLENVIINDPSHLQDLSFPKQKTLLIKSGNIPNFSKEIYTFFPETKLLHMYNNTMIRKFLIASSNLTELNLQRNCLQEFDVEPTVNRNLRTLTIVHNSITAVPKNIRFLESLEKLFLYNNSIEYVDLELFTNTSSSLKVLSLYDNFIKTLDSKLGLRFINLQTLSLSKNKLTYIPYFFDAFPLLNAISLRKNLWNCRWLDVAMKHITERKIQIARKDAACRDLWIGDVCCYTTVMDFVLKLQREELGRDREQLQKLSEQNHVLMEAVERLNATVHKLEEKKQDNNKE